MLIEIILCVIAITPYLFLIMFFKRFHYLINVIMDIENMLMLLTHLRKPFNKQIIDKN